MGGPWMLGLEPKPQCVTQAAIRHLVGFQWPNGSGFPKHCGLNQKIHPVCASMWGFPGCGWGEAGTELKHPL